RQAHAAGHRTPPGLRPHAGDPARGTRGPRTGRAARALPGRAGRVAVCEPARRRPVQLAHLPARRGTAAAARAVDLRELRGTSRVEVLHLAVGQGPPVAVATLRSAATKSPLTLAQS